VPKIKVDAYKCERCNHVWCPRNKDDITKTCPKCHSPYWDSPRKKDKR
jgi:hypothetical protein